MKISYENYTDDTNLTIIQHTSEEIYKLLQRNMEDEVGAVILLGVLEAYLQHMTDTLRDSEFYVKTAFFKSQAEPALATRTILHHVHEQLQQQEHDNDAE